MHTLKGVLSLHRWAPELARVQPPLPYSSSISIGYVVASLCRALALPAASGLDINDLETELRHPPFPLGGAENGAAMAAARELQPIYLLHLKREDGQVVWSRQVRIVRVY